MAVRQVYTCDRCGKEFEFKLKHVNGDTYRLSCSYLVDNGIDFQFSPFKELDLCFDCYNKLVEWFKKGKD